MKILILIIIGILLFPSTLLATNEAYDDFIKAKIGNNYYWLEMPKTKLEFQQGLSNRFYLAADHGMIFIFDTIEKHRFHMNKMLFPLDFIWVNNDKVIDITRNVKPWKINKTGSFTSNQPFNRTIELNAGEIDKSKIKIGDYVQFYIDE